MLKHQSLYPHSPGRGYKDCTDKKTKHLIYDNDYELLKYCCENNKNDFIFVLMHKGKLDLNSDILNWLNGDNYNETIYSVHESSLITKDVVWFEIQNITEFFNKPKYHNTKFIQGAISGGYNNQETSFKLHIDLSDMSQKEMIKSFVKKAICDLVEKNLDNTKTKDKKEHLEKLFNYYFLDNKLEIKNSHTSAPKI